MGQRVTFNVSQQMKTSPSEGTNLAGGTQSPGKASPASGTHSPGKASPAGGTHSPGKASPKHSPSLNRTASEPITVPHSVRSADPRPSVGSGESGSYPQQRSSVSPASPQVKFNVFSFYLYHNRLL